LQPDVPTLNQVFLHDLVVKKIKGRQVMMASNWDAGYVKLDVTDPTNITYLGDTDFTNPDPELLAQTGKCELPEGNAHYADFTKSNEFVVASDEDFSRTDSPATPTTAPPWQPIRAVTPSRSPRRPH